MAILVGIAFRPELADWIEVAGVDCLEVVAEEFYDGGLKRLQSLGQARPLILHGRQLSLGGPVPPDPREVDRFAAMTAAVNPVWVTAALGFSRVPGTDLGFSNPVPLNENSLSILSAHALQLMDACGKRLLFRNITGYLQFASSMPEPEFLNRLCARVGCGLCLDLTSLNVNGRNHGFNPQHWLAAIEPAHVTQIAVGACRESDNGWQVTHDCSPCTDVLALAKYVCAMAQVQAVVLERYVGFPPVAELARDLDRLLQLEQAAVC